MSYRTLDSNDAVDDHLKSDQPVWLFKHSNACGVSTVAFEAFTTYLQQHPDEQAAVVVVQEHRPVSNYIATTLGAVHKSPQLFLVHRGEIVWQSSHYGITAQAMSEARKAAA